ncbi:type II secretion system protein [Oceanimonas sp. CHS3-5]|uniref:type II secretion system protein n=1 Tax=Oceanimonas sp. CHS3-5 TaxID=3068186 RepID=UPI00273D1258|nr:type II secretion system protein [Oceanimonas sp. CHS3-5]MDP5293026.1 type II secretion system protein [Oceanimonas sp. CHS3-5]
MKRQHGFGLIEVMLAFIIVAATAGTLLQLNKTYLEYSRDGRSREVAMRLAESKLDELRRFQSRTGFDAIANGSDSVSLDDIDYNRDWAVTDYAWNSASSAWGTPSPSVQDTGKKQVAVTVNWTDVGEAQSFALDSVISPNTPASGGPFGTNGDNLGSGKGGPKVVHNPGAAPNVMSIELAPGLKMETSRPLPEVSKKGESTRVEFSTVTYDSSNVTQQRRDQVTVSCSCTLQSVSEGKLPAQWEMKGPIGYYKIGSNVEKNTGIPASIGQDILCTKCCGNHFDGPEEKFEHWYDVAKINNHDHYNNGTALAYTGDDYLEACRMVRINGYYETATDWNLVALNIFDADLLLNGDVASAYRDYVETVAVEYILSQINKGVEDDVASYYQPDTFNDYLVAKSISPATTDITMDVGLKQLMARGVYIDMISSADREYIFNEVLEGQVKVELAELTEKQVGRLLTLVPINEVNLTLLAKWERSSGDSSLTVTNEPVETITNANAGYYGVYSRGLAEAKSPGAAGTIMAKIKRSNSGMTSSEAISPVETQDLFIKSNYLDIVVNNSAKASITGEMYCVLYIAPVNANGPWKEEACSLEGVVVKVGNEVCGQLNKTQGNKSTIYYDCKADPDTTAALSATVPSGYEVYSPVNGVWTVAVPDNATTLNGGCLILTQNRPVDKTPTCN